MPRKDQALLLDMLIAARKIQPPEKKDEDGEN